MSNSTDVDVSALKETAPLLGAAHSSINMPMSTENTPLDENKIKTYADRILPNSDNSFIEKNKYKLMCGAALVGGLVGAFIGVIIYQKQHVCKGLCSAVEAPVKGGTSLALSCLEAITELIVPGTFYSIGSTPAPNRVKFENNQTVLGFSEGVTKAALFVAEKGCEIFSGVLYAAANGTLGAPCITGNLCDGPAPGPRYYSP